MGVLRDKQITVRVTSFAGELEDRRDLLYMEGYSTVAKRDLERYYQVVRDSTPRFKEHEARAIVEALNGQEIDARTYRYAWAAVETELRARLAARWHVEAGPLVERLRNLSPGATMALVDAVERVWVAVQKYPKERVSKILVEVGLVEPAEDVEVEHDGDAA